MSSLPSNPIRWVPKAQSEDMAANGGSHATQNHSHFSTRPPAEPPDPDARRTIELDPEFLEQARREQLDMAFDA